MITKEFNKEYNKFDKFIKQINNNEIDNNYNIIINDWEIKDFEYNINIKGNITFNNCNITNLKGNFDLKKLYLNDTKISNIDLNTTLYNLNFEYTIDFYVGYSSYEWRRKEEDLCFNNKILNIKGNFPNIKKLNCYMNYENKPRPKNVSLISKIINLKIINNHNLHVNLKNINLINYSNMNIILKKIILNYYNNYEINNKYNNIYNNSYDNLKIIEINNKFFHHCKIFGYYKNLKKIIINSEINNFHLKEINKNIIIEVNENINYLYLCDMDISNKNIININKIKNIYFDNCNIIGNFENINIFCKNCKNIIGIFNNININYDFNKNIKINLFGKFNNLTFTDIYTKFNYINMNYSLIKTLNYNNCNKLFNCIYNFYKLNLNNCNIKKLPNNLYNLKELKLTNCNKIKNIPDNLINLKELEIDNCNKINKLPNNLINLEKLTIYNCENIKEIPNYIVNLQLLKLNNYKNLKISNNLLNTIINNLINKYKDKIDLIHILEKNL